MRIHQFVSFVGAVAASVLLSGCSYIDAQGTMMPDYGHAVRANIAAQVAEPEPHYLRQVEPASNGARAVSAVDRYEHGEVHEPVTQKTSSVSSGGGGGGGGGGGSSGGQ
jgi:type IV pilus biogenesis protein CpaD/CtpE